MFNVQSQGLGVLPLNIVVPGIHDEEIIIRDEKGVELYKKPASKAEADQFIQTNGKSIGGSGLLRGLFIPIRTDNFIDFANDLFLPSYFNIASEITKTVPKIFASIAAIFFDLLTFKIRLIAAPFRLIYNYFTVKEHPLIAFVKNNPQAKEAIKKGSFEIVYRFREVQLSHLGLGGLGDTASNFIEEKAKLVITKKNLKTRTKSYERTVESQSLMIDSHPLFTGHFWKIIKQSNTPHVHSSHQGQSF